MKRLLLVLLLFLAACQKNQSPTRFEGSAMTIPYCIQVGGSLTEEKIKEIEEVIQRTFEHIHVTYDNWNPESEISHIKTHPPHKPFALSEPLASFLTFVDNIVKKTEGRFDPTIEPLQQLWKKKLSSGDLPSLEERLPLESATGWNHLHFDGQTVWKDHALTALDLGGIAKGHAVDLIAEKLYQKGYQSIYVEWGGEIRVVGHHPSGRPWKIGIRGLESIELSDAAIATSGSYIQNWTIEESTYTHIIDPTTLTPLSNGAITSVTVIAPTCAEADGLATALMLFPSISSAQTWAHGKNLQVYIW